MEKIFVEEDKIKQLKHLNSALNEESDIFVQDNSVYKIYTKNNRNKVRERFVDKLATYSHPDCVFPRYKIMDQKTSKFIGIEEPYLKKFHNLRTTINKNIPFDKRKEYAHKICQISKVLESMGISFLDIHPDNIMIKKDELKFIDLDGAEFVSKIIKSDVFEYIRKSQIASYLAEVAYYTLYGKVFNIYEVRKEQRNKLYYISNIRQQRLLELLFARNEILDVERLIDSCDEDYIEQSRLIIKK